MLQTLVQDYLNIAMKASPEEFCAGLGGPVLVAVKTTPYETFKQATTEMGGAKPRKDFRRSALSHQHTVIELRRADGRPLDSIILGRSEDCDVVFDDETISARHARLFRVRTTGEILIEDLHSRNGTIINGRTIIPERTYQLSDGDEIVMGDSTFLYFSAEGFYEEIQKLIEL
jgi:hypothetical protein